MQAAAAEARDRGVKRLWLEVLVQNTPAIGLYERLGYARVRELEVWALDRFPDLSLAVPKEELQPLPTFIMNGHRTLPVRLSSPVAASVA